MAELRKRQLLTRAELDALDVAAKAEEKRHLIWLLIRGTLIVALEVIGIVLMIRGLKASV